MQQTLPQIRGTAGTTDNALLRADGTIGRSIQGNSQWSLGDNGSLAAAGGTVTADTPLLSLAQTWNNSGVTFTGFKLNITKTQAASGSMLMDLQEGGSSRLKCWFNGSHSRLTLTSATSDCQFVLAGSDRSASIATSGNGNGVLLANAVDFVGTGVTANWYNANYATHYGTIKAFENSTAASLVCFGSAAQTFGVANARTSSTVGEWLKLGWSSNVAHVGTEKGASGGAARDMVLVTDGAERIRLTAAGAVIVSGLPTSNPAVAGQLWNDSGVVKISAG